MADAVLVMALASRDAANRKELSERRAGLIYGNNGTNGKAAACLNMVDKRRRIQTEAAVLKLKPKPDGWFRLMRDSVRANPQRPGERREVDKLVWHVRSSKPIRFTSARCRPLAPVPSVEFVYRKQLPTIRLMKSRDAASEEFNGVTLMLVQAP
jgi:hypothetical protein